MEWDVVARAERQSYQWLNEPVETASCLQPPAFSFQSSVSLRASRGALLVFCFSAILFQSSTETG